LEIKRLKGPNNRGVKLHHPTLKNCVFTLEQQNVIYPKPFDCPTCGTTHIFKTFHLNLNEHGDVTVHEQIYELFKSEGIVAELNAKTEVTPRPTFLGMGSIGIVKDPNGNTDVAQVQGMQAPYNVVSREHGHLIAPMRPMLIRNAVLPPVGRFKRNPDGTWTDLDKVRLMQARPA
jgi:hypothetical protein